jgi:hypothetical protein
MTGQKTGTGKNELINWRPKSGIDIRLDIIFKNQVKKH